MRTQEYLSYLCDRCGHCADEPNVYSHKAFRIILLITESRTLVPVARRKAWCDSCARVQEQLFVEPAHEAFSVVEAAIDYYLKNEWIDDEHELANDEDFLAEKSRAILLRRVLEVSQSSSWKQSFEAEAAFATKCTCGAKMDVFDDTVPKRHLECGGTLGWVDTHSGEFPILGNPMFVPIELQIHDRTRGDIFDEGEVLGIIEATLGNEKRNVAKNEVSVGLMSVNDVEVKRLSPLEASKQLLNATIVVSSSTSKTKSAPSSVSNTPDSSSDPIDLSLLGRQFAGRAFGELILSHCGMWAGQRTKLSLQAMKDGLPAAFKGCVEPWIALIDADAKDPQYWGKDCGVVARDLFSKARRLLMPHARAPSDDAVFAFFQIAVLHLACSANANRLVKRDIQKMVGVGVLARLFG
jgi:hypothetical protein